MEIDKNRKQIRIYISEDDNGLNLDWIDRYVMTHHLSGRGEVFEELYKEHQEQKRELEDQDRLAKMIANEVKESLTPIQTRLGYVDKNLQVLLQLLNSYILTNNIENRFAATTLTADPLRRAQEEVASILHANNTKLNERKSIEEGRVRNG